MRHEFKKGTLEKVNELVTSWIDQVAVKVVKPVTKALNKASKELSTYNKNK